MQRLASSMGFDNGAIGTPEEPTSKDGKDAFHRVPFILGEVRDAVERVLTRFRVAKAFRRTLDTAQRQRLVSGP